MNENRERRYMGYLTEQANVDSGMGTFTTYGYLTPCGEWVEIETISMDKQRHQVIRHKADKHWCETPAQALAMKAPRLRAIAERMLRQADELEQAAQEETRDRPALAAAANSSQQ
jgi:hypothetical protein